MDEQAQKIKRSNFLIKSLMALVVLLEAISYYQTNILNFANIATSIGILVLLRGLLLSPMMFSSPVKSWFKENIGVNQASRKYFALSFIFIVIGMIRYI